MARFSASPIADTLFQPAKPCSAISRIVVVVQSVARAAGGNDAPFLDGFLQRRNAAPRDVQYLRSAQHGRRLVRNLRRRPDCNEVRPVDQQPIGPLLLGFVSSVTNRMSTRPVQSASSSRASQWFRRPPVASSSPLAAWLSPYIPPRARSCSPHAGTGKAPSRRLT